MGALANCHTLYSFYNKVDLNKNNCTRSRVIPMDGANNNHNQRKQRLKAATL